MMLWGPGEKSGFLSDMALDPPPTRHPFLHKTWDCVEADVKGNMITWGADFW